MPAMVGALPLAVLFLSAVAGAPFLWADDADVHEWLPHALARKFRIESEVVTAILVGCGFAVGFLTEKLRVWRQDATLRARLARLAGGLADALRLGADDEDERAELLNSVQTVIVSALECRDVV